MKMLFASDVHGSFSDMEELIERIREERPNFVMFLGDFCGYAENLLFGESMGKLTVPYAYVRGNCDSPSVLSSFGFNPEAYVCTEKFGKRYVYGTHGHIYNCVKPVPTVKSGDIFVCGHTHVPALFYKDGVNMINCGSMARPRSSDGKTYAVIDDNNAYIRNGTTGKTIREIKLI